jgi:hypothetical protein
VTAEGMLIKRLLTITFLVLCRGAAPAEWDALDEKYQSPGLRTVYINRAAIHREGNLVTLWQLIDFQLSQGDRGGFRHILSTKTQKQFDCANKRVRLLAFMEFSRRMGTGLRNVGYVDTGIWLSVEPESLNHALWELACGRSSRGNHD